VVVTPGVGWAAPAAAPAAAAAPESDAGDGDEVPRAEALYDKGAAKFETADYAAAIELWTEAYEMVPDAPESGRIKALLIYNIATAREKAYDVSRDVAELRQAKILLERFAEGIDDVYGDDAAAERTRVEAKLAELDARIEKAEGGSEVGPKDVEPPADAVPAETGSPKPGRPLVITGAVLLGVGAVGVGLMAAGLGIGAGANDLGGLDDADIEGRRDQFSRGRLGNGLAFGGGIAGGAFAVTGAVLLGLGMAKNKRAPKATAWVGREGGGLSLAGRF
jgi:tetratricopeptide (TPR) repeat protein